MGSLSNIAEICMDPKQPSNETNSRRPTVVLKRLFSRESIADIPGCAYDVNSPSNYQYSLCGREFLLKIAQILVSITCAGIYTDSVQNILDYSTSSLLFPNVVFSCCIINTSVIALGYILGQVMPEVLIRAFNAIAIILFFTTACIIGTVWFIIGINIRGIEGGLLLAQVFTCTTNVVLYSVDLGFSVNKALRGN